MTKELGGSVIAIMSGLEVYQTALLQGICGVLGDQGIPLLAFVNHDRYSGRGNRDSGPVIQSALACLLRHHRPRGALVSTSLSGLQAQALAGMLAELEISAVYIGQQVAGQTCVSGDNEQGTTALMAHLLDGCGVRMPVMVRGYRHHGDHQHREEIFRREVSRRGITLDEELFVDGAADRELTRDAMRRLLQSRRDFDAVVTTDDWCALAAIDAITEAGLQVPQDVAVTGFDNYPAAALSWPGLTTVDQSLSEQGATAARLLLARLGGAAPGGTALVRCRLVIRGSTTSAEDRGDGQPSAETVIRSAQQHQKAHDGVRRISRALMKARTLAEIGEMLAAGLYLLDVRRCFLVIYETPDTPGPDGVGHRDARLLLDYRDGHSHRVPDRPFSSCQVLPAHLTGELDTGFLARQPLTGTDGLLGYLLTDHPLDAVATADALRMDLSKTLEIVFSTIELEQRVERRTADLRAANTELTLAAGVFEYAQDGILILDAAGLIVSANPALAAMTGFSAEELAGSAPQLLREGSDTQSQDRVIGEALARQGRWDGELWHRRKNGEAFLARVSLSTVGAEGSPLLRYVSTLSDITELHRKDERIRHLAFHDHLTELPNRALLAERLEDRITLSRRAAEPLGVLFVDLDRFKVVNDSYGHDTGNELLKLLAGRLQECLRDSDTVARVGGDEFVVLLSRTPDPQDYAVVAQRIITALSEPAVVDGHLLQVGATIGIACFPEDGQDAAELIKNADAAMYSAKSAGRGRFCFFETDMTARARQRLDLEMALRSAEEKGELELFYQPKLAMATGELIGVEALVRWRHPERGLIPPLEFIPMAEETGIITSLGRWVLHEACRQVAVWRGTLGRGISVAINTSAVQLRQTDLVTEIVQACEQHGISPADLEVELTESTVMSNLSEVAPMFSRLRKIGVTVSVDDFGTGYSSLAYLGTLPIDVMKIDRSFITNMDTSKADREIVKVIIALAQALGLALIAEGVETQQQADLLISYGCGTAQGFLFSRPLPAAEFERWFLARQATLRA